jgi:hypothetical protein
LSAQEAFPVTAATIPAALPPMINTSVFFMILFIINT